jgi:hypothetical protein
MPMPMRYALADGLVAARRAWPVALVLWAWTLVLAGPASLPFFNWLRGQIGYSPEGDLLLQRFRLDLFAELSHSAQGSAWAALAGAVVAMLFVAAIGRAFVTGGLIEAMSPAATGPMLWRFFGGAGRWFLPNLALLVINATAMFVVLAIASVATAIAVSPLADTSSPAVAWIALVGPLAVSGIVVLLFAIVYDYACIHVARQSGIWRGWLGALWFVARHLVGAAGLWIVIALLTAAGLAVYLGVRSVVPASNWPLIVFMVILQQTFMLGRAWLRAALVAAEVRYAPVPVLPPAPAPAPAAPPPIAVL